MANKPVSISFIGVDERSKSAYQLFFESNKQVRYKLVDDYRKAQVCLIDKDAYHIQQQYKDIIANYPYHIQQQYKDIIANYPEKYIVIFSIVDHAFICEKEFFLKKPIKRKNLQVLLDEIYSLISSAEVSDPSAPINRQIKKTVLKYHKNT